ncbi:AraC family ligand binding domain-containing protein (plasmid) [Acinetobacter johnsonii]|nr:MULTISPECIES: AraC family ligand binding domain-containing protein [Acinetobacter]UUG47908.1 AraC family ligand binding domain-containing protein [Acinetobacter baumannii]WEI02629.1 AraC family ligand binding domain-containing protein [Acinetobacter johnsonii]WEI11518.1 AraC family ligand binding domain-containing protein [Acinetobacter soli]WEI20369.1 AraC family ligand binding domain-containing protein [Acinetobacter proteolyticus]
MSNWVNVTQDKSTGIELIHAHFKGFAYDPHLHSSYLIGVTELGHQQFNCRKKLLIAIKVKLSCLNLKKFMMVMHQILSASLIK